MDGCEVARQLRRIPETSKSFLVAITGYGREADVQRCKEAGIDLHFVKPAEPDEIKKVLETAAFLASSGTVSTS
jgi:CheY-like chemotaxis protein